MTLPTPPQLFPAPHDRQRTRVYKLDAMFWSPRLDDTRPYCEILTLHDWAEYCEMLFTDGLRTPYQDQIRRSRRTPRLLVEPLAYPGYALAHLRTDYLQVSPDLTRMWVALHEVAHLLVPHCITAPHYWRWMSVYMQMVERHAGRDLARIFHACAIGHSIRFEPKNMAMV